MSPPPRKETAIPRASSRSGAPHTLSSPACRTAAEPIRVACVPSGHDYSRALAGWGLDFGDGDAVEHLPDPAPLLATGTTAAPGQWWPPRMLDSEWITANRGQFDLTHVQFGVEQVELHALARACDALRASGAPLIITVHDLINPHLRSSAEAQKPHTERLDLLIGRADEIITLTSGAAAEISARWGRRAHVIAHPAIVSPRQALPVGTSSADAVIAVHLGDLRANVRGLNTVVAVIAAADALRQRGTAVRVRVHLRSRVRDIRERDAILRACAGTPYVDVVESERHSDTNLLRLAADTDVCVLPYGHGTHSGWLELYYDLGVSVVSPDIGYFSEQHDDVAFFFPVAPSSGALLASSMTDALADALEHPLLARAGSTARARLQYERRALRDVWDRDIRSAHSSVYRRALAGVSS